MPHDGNTSHTVFDKNAASDTKMISLRYDYFTALEEVASAARAVKQRIDLGMLPNGPSGEALTKALTKLDQLNGRVR